MSYGSPGMAPSLLIYKVQEVGGWDGQSHEFLLEEGERLAQLEHFVGILKKRARGITLHPTSIFFGRGQGVSGRLLRAAGLRLIGAVAKQLCNSCIWR